MAPHACPGHSGLTQQPLPATALTWASALLSGHLSLPSPRLTPPAQRPLPGENLGKGLETPASLWLFAPTLPSLGSSLFTSGHTRFPTTQAGLLRHALSSPGFGPSLMRVLCLENPQCPCGCPLAARPQGPPRPGTRCCPHGPVYVCLWSLATRRAHCQAGLPGRAGWAVDVSSRRYQLGEGHRRAWAGPGQSCIRDRRGMSRWAGPPGTCACHKPPLDAQPGPSRPAGVD